MSETSHSSVVTFEQDGPVARIVFDDGKANVLSPQAIAQLNRALDQAEGRALDQAEGRAEGQAEGRAEGQAKARAVVLTGRTGMFSAGFDLKTMQAGPQSMREMVHDGAQLMARLFVFPCPVIMACTGHALAAGAVTLLTADVCIGAEGEFKIGLNEVSIGLPLPLFAMELARARLCGRHLIEATGHARIYTPAEALQVGFLHRVAPPQQVVALAMDHARQLAGSTVAGAYRQTKARARQTIAQHILDTLDDDLDAFGFVAPG